jgi:uncharacterized protein YneF (UPF0154 family)
MDVNMINSISPILVMVISFSISGSLTYFITRKFGRKQYDYLLILTPILFWIPVLFITSNNMSFAQILGEATGSSLIGGIVGYFLLRKRTKKKT